MNKVLLTGARGFVGRHCLSRLIGAGFEVHAVSSSTIPPQAVRRCVWHVADLLNTVQADRLIDEVKPTCLLHLAWITAPGEYWTSPLNDTWRKASEHLIESAASNGVKRVVVAGTCAEYDWSAGRCDEKTTLVAPKSPYSRSKDELRTKVESLSEQHGFGAAWARLFFLYGPGEPAGRLVPSIVNHLLQDEPAECSEGMHRRDFMYIQDAAAALVALVQSDLAGPVNVGSGKAVAIRDIAMKLGQALGKPHLIRLGARNSDRAEPPLVVAGTDRLEGDLGFRPRWDMDRGLADAIAWWRSQ